MLGLLIWFNMKSNIWHQLWSISAGSIEYLLPLGFGNGSVRKNLPAMQETWIPSLGQEDTLEKGMATHS